MSLFFVDSASDLNFQQIKELGIESISLPFEINSVRGDLTPDFDYVKMYSKLKKGMVLNALPLTEDEYINIFDKCLAQDDIVYVHSSSKIFDLKNLFVAREKLLAKYPERTFQLIDSNSFSIGQGVISYECALKYRNGASIDEIVQFASKIIREYSFYFGIDNISNMTKNNLVASSEISGTALNVKPMLTVDYDGEIAVVDRFVGRKRIFNKLIEYIRQKGQNVADYKVFIVHTGAATDANNLQQQLAEKLGNDCLEILQASPSVAALTGLGLLGLCFHVNKKIC